MGCNNSRLSGSGEILPARIRPLLRHRIEEFRKRRNGVTLRGQEGTLSKKQLLKDDSVVATEDGNSQSSDENETEEIRPVKEQSIARVEKLSKVVPLPVSESRTEENCNEDKDHEQERGKVIVKKNEEPQVENYKHEEENEKHGDNDDDEEEQEDKDGDDSGRLMGPGSPSFKIYCTEAEKKEEEESREKQTITMHQKTPSIVSVESAPSASGNSRNSNEVVEIESTPKRKGSKIKKLGAMKKNLLNVKNLHMNRMNPMMACTGIDKRSLLSEH